MQTKNKATPVTGTIAAPPATTDTPINPPRMTYQGRFVRCSTLGVVLVATMIRMLAARVIATDRTVAGKGDPRVLAATALMAGWQAKTAPIRTAARRFTPAAPCAAGATSHRRV